MRQDFHFALLASVVSNIAISVYGKKNSTLTVPLDFMPDWTGDRKKEVKVQTPEQIRAIFRDIARVHNRSVNDRGAGSTPRLKPQPPRRALKQ